MISCQVARRGDPRERVFFVDVRERAGVARDGRGQADMRGLVTA